MYEYNNNYVIERCYTKIRSRMLNWNGSLNITNFKIYFSFLKIWSNQIAKRALSSPLLQCSANGWTSENLENSELLCHDSNFHTYEQAWNISVPPVASFNFSCEYFLQKNIHDSSALFKVLHEFVETCGSLVNSCYSLAFSIVDLCFKVESKYEEFSYKIFLINRS